MRSEVTLYRLRSAFLFSRAENHLETGHSRCTLNMNQPLQLRSMKPTRRPRPALRYGTAVLSVGAALGLKLLLVPFVTQDAPFQLFFIAVMLAAWYGGPGPALLAMALAATCD